MNFGEPCHWNIRDYSKPHGLDGISGHGGNDLYGCYGSHRSRDNFLLFGPKSPTHNYTFNINCCCGNTPSWKTTLFAELTNFAFKGLALWGLSKWSGKQKAQQPQNNFWNTYIQSRFTLPTLPTITTTTVVQNPPEQHKKQLEKQPKEQHKAAEVTQNYDGEVSHGDNQTIRGTIPASSVKYEHAEGTDENSKKYPSEFVIYDTQNNKKVDVDGDTNGDIKGNKYTFTFVKVDNGQAIYELSAVKAVKADGSEVSTKFNKVQYKVTSGLELENGKYQIKTSAGDYNDIKMDVIANQPEKAVSTSQLKNPTNPEDTGVEFENLRI